MLGHRIASAVLAAATVVLFTTTPGPALGALLYQVTDLGDFPGGTNVSRAEGISNQGQVVGNGVGTGGGRGFLWDPTTMVMTDLGDLPGGISSSTANAINDNSQVTGFSGVFGGTQAFVWDSGTLTNIGDLPGGNVNGLGNGINDAGKVAGFSQGSVGSRGFIYEPASGGSPASMTPLDPLAGGTISSALAINNSDQVAGWSLSSSGQRAVVWAGAGATPTNLGVLTGGAFSTGYGINDKGEVVGTSGVAGGGSHAFLYDPATGMMVDLGDLPGGSVDATAFDVNEAGQAVGRSSSAAGDHAFLWDNGTLFDLNDLIDPTDPLFGLVTLGQAKAINDSGQIVGQGLFAGPFGPQVSHAFLLTPVPQVAVPEPGTFALFVVGLAGLMVTVRRRPQRCAPGCQSTSVAPSSLAWRARTNSRSDRRLI